MTVAVIDELITSATTSSIGKPRSDIVPFKERRLNFKIGGITGSTVEIQVSLNKGTSWEASEVTSADVTKSILHASPDVWYRFEVTAYGGADQIQVLLLN